MLENILTIIVLLGIGASIAIPAWQVVSPT